MIRQIFISGRVVRVPEKADDPSPINGALFLMVVRSGETEEIWSFFFRSYDQLSGQIADGDMVAVVGFIEESREKTDEIEGPVMAEAILAMNRDGHFFGRIGESSPHRASFER